MPYKDKAKQREYQRNWVAKRRAEWFERNGPCVKCGSEQDLELDHVDPSQKVDHMVWSWSEPRRTKELAKCQALCKTCHEEKTREFLQTSQHGDASRYNAGCRCDLCRKAASARVADWRNRKKQAAEMKVHAVNT